MNISAVLFDLDGTLIDSYQGVELSFRKAVEVVIPNRVIPKDLRRRIGPPVREVFQGCFDGISSEELDELTKQFRNYYDNIAFSKAVLYPGTEQILQQLKRKQIPNFVITNKPIIPTRKILDLLAITNYFSGLLSRYSRIPSYSSKDEMILELLKEYCFIPDRVIMVGDTLEDAKAAMTSGTRFAAANYGYGFRRNNGPFDFPIHFRLDSISDLLNVLGLTIGN